MSIKIFIKRLFRKKRYAKAIVVEKTSTIPPDKNTILIVSKGEGIYSWVKFYCPCGCNKEIKLSLNKHISPTWRLSMKNSSEGLKVTLSPSVYMTGHKCKSHFFIKDNKIEWVD